MKKIAYIVDSASFINKEQAKELDLFFVPLHIIVKEEDYLEGENLDTEKVIEAIKNKQSVSTSQPSPGETINLIERLKQQGYDTAIFSSIGSKLSRTLENTLTTAEMEGFKIYPIDSCNVGYIQLNALLKARKLINDGSSIEDALIEVRKDILASTSLLVPDDLFHLSRGGRITKAAAALGSMLKIKPILEVLTSDGGKIDAVDKVRTSKKAYARMIDLALNDRSLDEFSVIVAHYDALDKAHDFVLKLQEKYPQLQDIEI
ncbi:MAG: DegV family protein, partial [Bacilli bacterium]